MTLEDQYPHNVLSDHRKISNLHAVLCSSPCNSSSPVRHPLEQCVGCEERCQGGFDPIEWMTFAIEEKYLSFGPIAPQGMRPGETLLMGYSQVVLAEEKQAGRSDLRDGCDGRRFSQDLVLPRIDRRGRCA